MNDGQEGTERVLLKDQAYENLKNLILEEVFAPGTFLSERQLAARLDMSKTPIRSALERLETEGFVTVSPQQGIVVRESSLREIVDLFDIRIALEVFVVQSIAGRLNAGCNTTSRMPTRIATSVTIKSFLPPSRITVFGRTDRSSVQATSWPSPFMRETM